MILDDANGTKGIKIFNHSGCSSWAAEHWKSKESGVFFLSKEWRKEIVHRIPSFNQGPIGSRWFAFNELVKETHTDSCPTLERQVSHDGNHTTSTLSYRPTAEDHGRSLKCHVENLKLPVAPVEVVRVLQLKCEPFSVDRFFFRFAGDHRTTVLSPGKRVMDAGDAKHSRPRLAGPIKRPDNRSIRAHQ